jgi:hypothetical protein
MFTARPDLERDDAQRFAEALSGMSYDNPGHRAVLEAEGLKRWVQPQLDGYDSLRMAGEKQGFFKPDVRPRRRVTPGSVYVLRSRRWTSAPRVTRS